MSDVLQTKTEAPTRNQRAALKWLKNRGGDGVFDKTNVLIAGGERAGVMRSTWNTLEALGLVEFYLNRRRVKLTVDGERLKVSDVEESDCTEMER